MNALLAALRPALVSFFSRTMPFDAAEDLAQAALVRIHRALPNIDAARAHPYIVTVAYNLARTAYAQSARDNRRMAPEQSADAIPGPTAADRHTQYRELARAVHRVASAKMPQPQREVVLGLLRGDTPAEIANQLGISPVTVRTRLMRARAVLHRELRPFLDDTRQDCAG
ncbi:sigma-70 family RNA polymerase sigma factor [Longimicrobium sp.]|uniref:RNA polymerase sigma factor n=1 Tax=Longimicrobium sp. TaxID=2029185 RepID=UPI002E346A3E|nr:sigma-70 family RNA polymerase sigma factor [Longimicrobium sp.]HEX6037266.1 sigma-70 family RNA polymerase sigma factor [Longimicrobium sp.]